MRRVLSAILVCAMPFVVARADAGEARGANVSLVYEHELPNVPGRSIRAVVVEYGPGGFSAGHAHPASAFIYATVLEGAVVSQVNDGPVRTYRAGQSFTELPGDRHRASANGSKTRPAKLLAVLSSIRRTLP
jgi:quercetin dioxygenase-like cupin family protein